jgi:hypothetical protein
MNMLSPLLNSSIPFVPEDETDAMKRYSGFAADFYARLYSQFPALRGVLRIYRLRQAVP